MNSEKTARRINAVLVGALVFALLQYLYLQNRISFLSAQVGGLEKRIDYAEMSNSVAEREAGQLRGEVQRLREENERLKKGLKVGVVSLRADEQTEEAVGQFLSRRAARVVTPFSIPQRQDSGWNEPDR